MNNLNLLTNSWKIHKKCSNGHGYYYFKCHYYNRWLINVQSPKNCNKSTSTLTSTKVDVIDLEFLKWQPTQSIWIMPQVKFQKIWFWDEEIEKQTKFASHRNLWKHGSILTIQKALTIKWLRFSKKIILVWIYHFMIHHISNNFFGMWININIFILWCFSQTTNSYFSTLKIHYFKQMIVLSINNHTILFIL